MSACIDKLVLPPRYIYRGGAVPPPRRETHLARAGVSGVSTLSARAGPSHSAICARGTAPPWGGTATLGLCEYCDPLGTVSSLTLYTQRNLCVLVCDVTSAQQCCCVLR